MCSAQPLAIVDFAAMNIVTRFLVYVGANISRASVLKCFFFFRIPFHY